MFGAKVVGFGNTTLAVTPALRHALSVPGYYNGSGELGCGLLNPNPVPLITANQSFESRAAREILQWLSTALGFQLATSAPRLRVWGAWGGGALLTLIPPPLQPLKPTPPPPTEKNGSIAGKHPRCHLTKPGLPPSWLAEQSLQRNRTSSPK